MSIQFGFWHRIKKSGTLKVEKARQFTNEKSISPGLMKRYTIENGCTIGLLVNM